MTKKNSPEAGNAAGVGRMMHQLARGIGRRAWWRATSGAVEWHEENSLNRGMLLLAVILLTLLIALPAEARMRPHGLQRNAHHSTSVQANSITAAVR